MIKALFDVLIGLDRNVLRETVEVFRENAEAGAERAHQDRKAALDQFAAEFARAERSTFDTVIDGLNRLPRPMLAFATLLLLSSAMVDPVWFALRMEGLLLVPEPLWWLLGVIVSFYFGARHQAKSQDFQRSLTQMLALVPEVTGKRRGLTEDERPQTRPVTRLAEAENAALSAWRASERQQVSAQSES
jgi:hypothetical protein